MKYATQKQIKRLYALLYVKGLDQEQVEEAANDIRREVGVYRFSDMTDEDIKRAYTLVDYVNYDGKLVVDTPYGDIPANKINPNDKSSIIL